MLNTCAIYARSGNVVIYSSVKAVPPAVRGSNPHKKRNGELKKQSPGY